MATSTRKSNAEAAAEAREKAAALKLKQAARARRNKQLIISGIAVGVVAVVAIVVIIVQGSKVKGLSDVKNPTGATSNGGIAVGKSGEAGGSVTSGSPTISVYIDYQCPACKSFDTSYNSAISSLVDAGNAQLVVHPLNFLTKFAQVNSQFSRRAAADAAEVATDSPKQFLAFHMAMYENQPAEGSSGLTDAQIASIAQKAGVSQKAVDAISSGAASTTYGPWVDSATSVALAPNGLGSKALGSMSDENQGTPAVLISAGGHTYQWKTWNTQGTGLQQAIDAVKSGQDPSSGSSSGTSN